MFLVCLLFSLLSASDSIIWQELDLVFSDVSSGLQLALEADVFERLDVNGDNQLSEEEWRLFLESAAIKAFKDITEADMLELKQNLAYPVLEVTEDMDASQIENICDIVRQLEEMDLVEEFEKLFPNNSNPELLVEAALEIVRSGPVTVPERNFLKFDAYLEEVGPKARFSKDLQIPEECKQISASTRRRTFSGLVLDPIAITMRSMPIQAYCSTGHESWMNWFCKSEYKVFWGEYERLRWLCSNTFYAGPCHYELLWNLQWRNMKEEYELDVPKRG